MKRRRTIWILSIILVAAVLFLLFYDEKDVKILPSYKTSTMKTLKLTHRKGADIKWELSADRATMPVNEKKVYLEYIDVSIKENPEVRITSGSGVYELQAGDITLNKPVKMQTRDGAFTTDTLKWKSEENIVSTESPVLFTGKNFRVSGTGLVAQVDSKKVRISRDVKAVYFNN